MRHRLAILVPILLLAGCSRGGGNESANGAGQYDLPGGGFDRARFREATMDFCRTRLRSDPEVPSALLDPVCGCVADRVMADSDAALRALVRDRNLAIRRNDAAMLQCRGEAGEELPPPPETPPLAASPPTTGGGVPARGPDAGAGASAPGGTRAHSGPRGLAAYFSEDDYPAAALRNNQQGRVAFMLDIGADGRVTNCSITATSGSAALDMATCRILRSRARYTPARNPQGAAVADRDQGSISWVLPAD
jgi:TonB family protein